MRRIVSGIMLTLLLMGIFTLAFNIQQVDCPPSPSTEWNRTYGGVDYDEAMSVVQTGDGYALAGYTRSFGAGASDSWLVKTDSAGNHLWNQTYGGADVDIALSVVQTGDGGYALAGYTLSFGAGLADFWLVKTDASGTVQWNQTYGGSDHDYAYSVVQTGDGGYALAGYTSSFGAGGYDIWLVKTDASGSVQWNQTYGGADYDIALSLVQTGDGYVLAGSTDSFGAGEWDFWLVKTDASGSVQWNQTYGGADYDIALSLVQTGDGYVLAGYTWSFGAGASDSWLVKTDSAGNHLWNQTYGGTGADIALSVVQTGDGGYALAGSTDSFGSGLADIWLVKVAPDTIPGDFDGDGDVDRYDFGIFGGAYGSKVGDPNWNAVCELNGDGAVDRYDFGVFAGNYGKSV